jgi:hypothetical protein
VVIFTKAKPTVLRQQVKATRMKLATRPEAAIAHGFDTATVSDAVVDRQQIASGIVRKSEVHHRLLGALGELFDPSMR